MNKKYERYINYIVSDIEPPYFKNMRDAYGLRPDEYELILSKLFNQPVTIDDDSVKGKDVYDHNGKKIYYEDSNGYWYKQEYDHNGKKIYGEERSGYWFKYEYNTDGNLTYFEDSNGILIDNR